MSSGLTSCQWEIPIFPLTLTFYNAHRLEKRGIQYFVEIYSHNFYPSFYVAQVLLSCYKKGFCKLCKSLWLGWKDLNPRNNGVRVRCLTAWRHPRILVLFNSALLLYHGFSEMSIGKYIFFSFKFIFLDF